MSPMGKCRLWVNVSWLWSRSSWSSSQLFNFSLGQYVIGQVLTWSTYYMVNLVHQKIDFAHNIIYNWISHQRAQQGPQTKAELHISTIVWPPHHFSKIDSAQNIFCTWIYPTSGPDRAHRQRHNCIYPFMFGLQISFWKLTLHTTSSTIIGYIPPLGPTGPTDISFKTFTHAGNVLFTLCLWALSGPEVGYIQL